MLAGCAESFGWRSYVRLPMTATSIRNAKYPMHSNLTETTMRQILCGCVVLTVLSISSLTSARSETVKGKNCHMEQQCRWENFKKICTYVKVCR
jgi:hypothetical protein